MKAQRLALRRHYRMLLILAALLVFVTACLGGGGQAADNATPARQLGHEVVLSGQAFLTCSQACADRGHCGESSDRGQAVLLSIPGPAAQRHDWAISVDTLVTIEESRDETIALVASGEIQTARFYRVNVAERAASAWVAGWCVANSLPAP